MASSFAGLDLSKCAHGVLALLVGCGESIALGTDCPPVGARCESISAGPDAAAMVDAGPLPSDATDGRDASSFDVADAASTDGGFAPTEFPGFRNPSLEITSGAANGGLISTFAVQVSPWRSCSVPGFGPGAYPQVDLRANAPTDPPAASDLLTPTDGSALLQLSPDGTSIAQPLDQALVPDKPYAFVVDVAAEREATDLALAVSGSNGCLSPQPLTTTELALPGAWSAMCVRFTPTKAHGTLMLSALSASASTSARLFIDNIRSEPNCQ